MADVVAIAGGTRVMARQIGAAVGAPLVADVEIPEVESIGDISEQTAEVTATRLKDKFVRYIAGLSDGQPMEISMYLLTDNAIQEALWAAFRNRRELELTIQPDDTEKQYRFNWRPTGHNIRSGAAGDPKRRVMAGRINSEVTVEPNENPDFLAANT
jgi:hypothetical protein